MVVADTEEWVGTLAGDEMRMSYSRRQWTSQVRGAISATFPTSFQSLTIHAVIPQVFLLKRGRGVAPPPSPQRKCTCNPHQNTIYRGFSDIA